jgi:hypothetical protein
MNTTESQKPKRKLTWIIFGGLIILLLCCAIPVGYFYFKSKPFIESALATTTPTPEPIRVSFSDIGTVEDFQVTCLRGFLTKYDKSFDGFSTKPSIKEGEYLITIVFEIKNIGNVLPKVNSLNDLELKSPNNTRLLFNFHSI